MCRPGRRARILLHLHIQREKIVLRGTGQCRQSSRALAFLFVTRETGARAALSRARVPWRSSLSPVRSRDFWEAYSDPRTHRSREVSTMAPLEHFFDLPFVCDASALLGTQDSPA